jgi:hypothetical protein
LAVKAIVVMELRGFEAMAVQLAREGDPFGVTSERVRASSVVLMNGILDQAASNNRPDVRFHVGGDTWYFNFEALNSAIKFAVDVTNIALNHALSFGTFFLKPSLGVNIGIPKLDGNRFYDDYSITAYRFADKGKAFSVQIVGGAFEAIKRTKEFPFQEAEHPHPDYGPYGILEWQKIQASAENVTVARQVSVPKLLLDSDVQYSDSTDDAVEVMLRYQDRASEILSFGGPAQINQPLYRNYVKRTIASIKSDPLKKSTVLSYIPLDEPATSFGWLDLCRRLSYKLPGQFVFAAFPIPQGQLRPFAYHIYDKAIVFVGLRSFSPHRGTATLSAGIVFRAQQVAQRFREELLENFRKIGALDDSKFAALTSAMIGLTPELRRSVLSDVDNLLGDA